MRDDLLKLNEDKTAFLIITPRDGISKSLNTDKIGDQSIKPSDAPPKNLGIIFDTTSSLKHQFSNFCKSINYQLYFIGKI